MENINFWNKKINLLRSDIIVTPELIKLLKNEDLCGKKVLDFGCGDGTITNEIQSCGADVTGIDINEDLINLAKTNYDCNFIDLDGRKKLPFENESFDIIYSSMVFLEFDEKTIKKIYSELFRILKKNGKLFITNIHGCSLYFTLKSTLVTNLDDINKLSYFKKNQKNNILLHDINMKNSVNLQYYNHNLSSLINLGIDKNFILNKFKEVKPNTNNLKLFSKLNTETKVPSYIILEFEKQKSTYDYVLEKIENLERNWVYELSEKENKFHSFGRVPEDGNSVGFWSVPKRTANFLKTMIEVTNSKVILELGTSVGYSTLHMAKAIEHNEHAHILELRYYLKK